MTITPSNGFKEILDNSNLSFRDKLFHAHARHNYSNDDKAQKEDFYKNKTKFLEILLAKKSNDELYQAIKSFYKALEQSSSDISQLKENIKLILIQYENQENEQFNEININANPDILNLNANPDILNKNDFLEYANKSQFGGMQEGGIYISKKDGKLYFLKTHRANDVKLQDEYFLNNCCEIIASEYIPYKTYLINNGQTAISYVPQTYDLLNKIMKLGHGDIKFNNEEETKNAVKQGIEKYFTEELKGKKIYGLIPSIIMMALNYNLDGNPGNLIMKDLGNNKLQFFTIDPMQWSQDNKFKLNINEFIKEINQNFENFKNNITQHVDSKKIYESLDDSDDSKKYLIEFLQNCLITQNDNFIGAIKKGREEEKAEFMNEPDSAYISNIAKQEITRALALYLVPLINQLTNEEIQKELKPFMNINDSGLQELYNNCYNNNTTISNLDQNFEDNKDKGVQEKTFKQSIKNMELFNDTLIIIYKPQTNRFKLDSQRTLKIEKKASNDNLTGSFNQSSINPLNSNKTITAAI